MEARIGAVGAQIASLGKAPGSASRRRSSSTCGGDGGGGSGQQGSLLTACHALADCAEGMADSISAALACAGAHCGAHEQIEVRHKRSSCACADVRGGRM